MAESIGFAIVAAITETTVSAATASVIGSVAISAAAVGGNLLISALNQPKQRNETQQSVLNQAMGPRVRIYGIAMVGGSRAFFDTRNGALFQAIVIAADRIDGIEQYWIGDRAVQTTDGEAGGLSLDYPQTNKVAFEPHLGLDDQAASPRLLTSYPGVWTEAHKLAGLAYVVVTFLAVRKEEQQIVYPQGYATPLRFVVRGARVWDMTSTAQDADDKATWTFSQNPALCILDYLRHRDGMRFARSRIDVASFRAIRDLCAEPVARKDGTTVDRYRLGGTYTLSEAPKDVLARMCATCDAKLVRGPSGLIGIRGGRFANPSVNIPTGSIRTASLTQGSDRLDAYNRLKVSYTDPDNYYQPTELQAREDTASQAQVGVVDQVVDLVMVPDWTQAARLAKIQFAKDNPAWKGVLGTDLAALGALDSETVRATFDPLPEIGPILDETVTLTAFSLRSDMSGCDLGIASIGAATYAWDPATEEPPRPALPTSLARINVVATPTNVGVMPSRRNIAGGNTAVWAVLTWNAPARTDVVPEAQYRATGADESAFQPMTLRGDGLSAEAGPLADGQTYDVRVRFVAGRVPSEWSGIVTLQAVADATPPGPPTGFAVDGGAGQFSYGFTAPNSDNFGSARAYLGTTTNFDDATILRTFNGSASQGFERMETAVASGAYRLWIRALNRSGFGDASSTAGPMTVTVT